jgi:prolyl-tRNA synthetase
MPRSPATCCCTGRGLSARSGRAIYDYLPLAWRADARISDIVREEMNAAGASELLMPALEPFELFKAPSRHETYGDNLFRVTDRKGRLNALAPRTRRSSPS